MTPGVPTRVIEGLPDDDFEGPSTASLAVDMLYSGGYGRISNNAQLCGQLPRSGTTNGKPKVIAIRQVGAVRTDQL